MSITVIRLQKGQRNFHFRFVTIWFFFTQGIFPSLFFNSPLEFSAFCVASFFEQLYFEAVRIMYRNSRKGIQRDMLT